jgi:cell division protein FtsZ
MAGSKRASMREGPLAALFRKTETEGLEDGAEPPARPAAEPSADAPKIPSPQERLRHAFSSDLPENLMAPPSHEPAAVEHQYASWDGSGPVGKPQLRVVGVGGAGVNAVNRMIEAEVSGVEFIAVNTDAQSLQTADAHVTVQIGRDSTRGLGSGSDPDLGRTAAMEDYDRTKALLKGSDMVFITAGEGGGTGTGAAPVVARIARELGALTVGVVTKPFGFEGSRRLAAAEKGIEALREEVDTLIVVPNNRLLSVLEKNTSMVEAFRVADDVLRQGVQGISDLITLPGLINLDFADVRTIMADAGNALLDVGRGRALDPAVDHRRPRPLAVGGERGREGRPGGGPPRREHHLRGDARRQARRRGLDHGRRDRLRRPPAAAPRGGEPWPVRLLRAAGRAARDPQPRAVVADRRRRSGIHSALLT